MSREKRCTVFHWRGVITLLISVVFLALSSGFGSSWAASRGDEPRVAMTEVYAGAHWYQARPEPEKEWRGVLRERDAVVGPGARSALRYTLITGDRQLPVYAANVERVLAPFVGRQVIAYGKQVDLSEEGFGEELWIGSIGAVGLVPR